MPNTILVRRGLAAGIPIGADGELLWTTDTHILYVGQSGVNYQVSGGAGTVTSVGLAMPSQFAVSGSPVTGSGTLTAAWNAQTANFIFAGPASGGAAVPTFRAMVAADLVAHTSTHKLNELANPDGSVSLNSQNITSLATPSAASDAATKGYVDSVAQGLDVKGSVKAATTANITLSGEQTIDGVALVAGDRCLVKNQTATADNGIYLVAAGAWTRATDFDSWTEIPGGFCFVEQGTLADTGWVCTSDTGGTLGVTAITFTQFAGVAGYTDEQAQDAVGTILVDSNTIDLTYNDATPSITGDVRQQMSITSDASGLKLSGDAASPGSNKAYGTNGSGTKTWIDLPVINDLQGPEDLALLDTFPFYDLTYSGNRKSTFERHWGFVGRSLCQARLTLTSGTPVTTADVTAAGTIYLEPFGGNTIAVWDGTRWVLRTFTAISTAINLSANTNYDYFVYDSSGSLLAELVAWSSATARATALTTQNGILVKSGDATRRYIGTFRTVTATTTEDSAAKRFVFNYYNRVPRILQKLEGTDSWSYASPTWRQMNGSAANQVELVVGVAESVLLLEVSGLATASYGYISIGEDSTTTPETNAQPAQVGLNTGNEGTSIASLMKVPPIGYHYYTALEYASGSMSFYGDAGIPDKVANGLRGWTWG